MTKKTTILKLKKLKLTAPRSRALSWPKGIMARSSRTSWNPAKTCQKQPMSKYERKNDILRYFNFKDKTNKISEAEQKKIEQQIGKLKADVQAITAQLPPVAHVLGNFCSTTIKSI